jgi:protein ImuB
MYWIALLPSHEDERTAWGWRALQFTPRVAQVDEALLLEVSASLRLWGGRKRLLRCLFTECEPLAGAQCAQGATSLMALGLLRLKLRDEAAPAHLPQDLPLEVLSAAREHVEILERTGCRTWGDLRALPRAGVARRFGAGLLDALDAAYGERPERYPWLQLPEEFDLKFELASLATTAPELMWTAQRLLTQLQVWLQARHRGVVALEMEWTLDLRRLNGVRLPSHERLVVRTAQPTQDIAHLRRLVGEHLSRSTLSAPANHLRLRSLETLPWGGADKSLLPEDNVKGERLHQLVERLSVRLGESNVLVPVAQADHRPERMQHWESARLAPASPALRAGDTVGVRSKPSSLPRPSGERAGVRGAAEPTAVDALYPPWLLPQPLQLEVKREKPQYYGPLRLLAGPQRLETGWWDDSAQGPASRDYFIARSDEAGLLWVYRERLAARSGDESEAAPVRWFLQGIYA